MQSQLITRGAAVSCIGSGSLESWDAGMEVGVVAMVVVVDVSAGLSGRECSGLRVGR